MQLKDIADMEEYLANRCYCPGEIYDMNGFFFQIFKPEEDCLIVAQGESHGSDNHVTCVICRDQIINFWINSDDQIVGAERYDATEHNIKQLKDYWLGNVEKVELDEFEHNDTQRTLKDIMKYADAIIAT